MWFTNKTDVEERVIGNQYLASSLPSRPYPAGTFEMFVGLKCKEQTFVASVMRKNLPTSLRIACIHFFFIPSSCANIKKSNSFPSGPIRRGTQWYTACSSEYLTSTPSLLWCIFSLFFLYSAQVLTARPPFVNEAYFFRDNFLRYIPCSVWLLIWSSGAQTSHMYGRLTMIQLRKFSGTNDAILLFAETKMLALTRQVTYDIPNTTRKSNQTPVLCNL